jgi:multiple sugar transport system permease protein
LLFLLTISIGPLIFALLVSFRSQGELFNEEVYLLPKQPTLEGWAGAIDSMGPFLINSFIIAVGTAIIALLIVIPGAYVFGRKHFPGETVSFYTIVDVMMFPFTLLIIPIADLWSEIGLYNTIPGLWLSYQLFIVPFTMWVLRDFFSKLPTNLEESAQVYGCSQFSAFVRVILPLSAPAIVAVGFLAFQIGWSDFLMSNMLTVGGTGPRPAVVQLYLDTTGGEVHNWGLVMAEAWIVGFPPTLLYLWGRRYLAKSFEMA